MSNVNDQGWETPKERLVPSPNDFRKVANKLCEKALNDAKFSAVYSVPVKVWLPKRWGK